MEQVKFLRALPDLIYDVSSWPPAIGRYLRLSLRPWRAHAAVAAEWAKPREARFATGCSPSLFWILVVATPFFVLFDRWFAALAPGHPAFGWLAGLPWPARMLLVALVLSTWPMSAAALQSRGAGDGKGGDGGARDGRDGLQRRFETNCVAFAPPSLLLLAALLCTGGSPSVADPVGRVLAWAFMAWTLYAEACIAWCESRAGAGLLRRVDSTLACLGRGLSHGAVVVLAGVALGGIAAHEARVAAGAAPDAPFILEARAAR